MIYLDEKEIKIVKDILNKHLPGNQVRVFGSRVTGKIKPYSDLDLCVMGNAPLSLSKMADLREAFSESNLPIRVDLVDWASITPEFQAIILEQNEILQNSSS